MSAEKEPARPGEALPSGRPSVELDALLAEARALEILDHVSSTEVHCPTCKARLLAFGECPSCGAVGRSEEEVRRMDPKQATALLERSVARRKAYTPEKGKAKASR